MKITFHSFIMHSLNTGITLCIKFIEYRKNKHKVCSKCPPLTRTQARKHVRHWSTLTCVINQRLLQAAPHMQLVAVAGHRCHELWSHTHVAEWQTIAPDMWPPNSPDLNPVDYAIWSVIKVDAAGNILRVRYKSMKYDVSFSLGSVSTLFRWGGHFCHICVKHFFLLTAVQNYKNPPRLSRVTITKLMYCHLFMVHSV